MFIYFNIVSGRSGRGGWIAAATCWVAGGRRESSIGHDRGILVVTVSRDRVAPQRRCHREDFSSHRVEDGGAGKSRRSEILLTTP